MAELHDVDNSHLNSGISSLEHPGWVWTSGSEAMSLEPSDDKTVPPEDFRAKEVNQTVYELFQNNQRVVFVKANSGFGISKYYIPRLEASLTAMGLEMYHTEILTESDVKYADEYGDVLVIDEIGQSTGGFEGGVSVLTEIMSKNPNLKAIIVFDDTHHPEFSERLRALNETGLLGRVEMSPKLLSVSQAVDFAIHGAPFRRHDSRGTFFEGLDEEQVKAIIDAFAKKFPLHFRLIDILRWSGSNYDWDAEKEITFEERLKKVESGELDYEFEEKMAWDPMGIKSSST